MSIRSLKVPARPRSKNYPVGSVFTTLGGGGYTSAGGSVVDIIKELDTRTLSDSNVFSSLRTLLEIRNGFNDANEDIFAKIDEAINNALKYVEENFLSSQKTDTAKGLITFLQGLTSEELVTLKKRLNIGESVVDSLTAGMGILAENGRIQADRMELRSSLTVLELIYNRKSAMEGDYDFTESGTIDSVELLADGTYNLLLRKRWENDFTALAENDVVYGVVNNLSVKGSYYTSWMRVVSVNAVSNSINVVLYPNNEVPGGVNYPPEPLMVLSHRGNPVNEERQSYWYLSSREKCICMLDGVTKPILEEYNYACIIGKLKNLSLFDNLPINYRQTYNYVRGLVAQDILRVDYAGVPLRSENCRGKWAAGTYTSTSTSYDSVYHVGCKWMCIVSSTTAAPKWNSTDWAMIEGNSELTMSIASTHGNNFYAGRVATTFIPYVRWGNNDISADVLPTDWAWTRNSGNVTLDNSWAVAHAGSGRNLAISNEDLPPSWSRTNPVEFICTAYVRDGETVTQLSISKSV